MTPLEENRAQMEKLKDRLHMYQEQLKQTQRPEEREELRAKIRTYRAAIRDVQVQIDHLDPPAQRKARKTQRKRLDVGAMTFDFFEYTNACWSDLEGHSWQQVEAGDFVNLGTSMEQLQEWMAEGAQRLSAHQRQYLDAYYNEGLSQLAIAQRYGVDKSSVSRVIRNGLNRMQVWVDSKKLIASCADGKGGFTTPTISSDNLSTRGYQVLMKNVLGATDIKVAYIFTDWRMWIYLFDLVEGSGLGVRNMIVWNKQSPGMGNGWRAQHELIMFAHRTKPKWDNHKGYGNVLEATRSGNELHPTQKPVEILEKLLDNTQWAEGVLDTFGGSGTTLIAAESVGQQAFLMEMEPAFVDTIVRRYIRTTGKTTGIRLIRKGSEQPREVFEGIFE